MHIVFGFLLSDAPRMFQAQKNLKLTSGHLSRSIALHTGCVVLCCASCEVMILNWFQMFQIRSKPTLKISVINMIQQYCWIVFGIFRQSLGLCYRNDFAAFEVLTQCIASWQDTATTQRSPRPQHKQKQAPSVINCTVRGRDNRSTQT